MKEEIKRAIKEFKNGTKVMFKEFFNKDTNKKQRANMLTFLRLITPIITVILSLIGLISGMIPFLIGAGIITGLGALTDYLDGKSARKYGTSSKYGKLLDQISDKVFAGVIGINLLFINPLYILTLLGEAIIASVNIYYKLKYKNLNEESTMIGKIKEWPLFVTLMLGYISKINSICLLISNISIFTTLAVQLMTAESYLSRHKKTISKRNIKNTLEETTFTNEEEDLSKSKEYENSDIKNKIDEYKKLKEDITIISNSYNEPINDDNKELKLNKKR